MNADALAGMLILWLVLAKRLQPVRSALTTRLLARIGMYQQAQLDYS